MIFTGSEFDHELDMEIDLDLAVTLAVRYEKPSGAVVTLSGSRVAGTQGVIHHLLLASELDQAGDWKANPYVDFGNGKTQWGATVTFTVYAPGGLQ